MSQPSGRVLHLMYTADLAGEVERMPFLATVVRQQRALSPQAMLVDAGGWASGTALSDTFQGAPMIEIMNELGYQAAAVGRPDLAFSLDVLQKRAHEARFPLLSANLVDLLRRRIPGIEPFVRIGSTALIGISPPDCERLNLRVLDPVEAVAECLDNCVGDTFVVVSQLGREGDRALAAAIPSLHCIVGRGQETERIGDTVITGGGERARALGRLTLELSGSHHFEAHPLETERRRR